jgi:hypothetical protein
MCMRQLTRAAAISAAGPVGPVCAAKAGLPLLGDAKPPAQQKTSHKPRNAPLGRRVVGEWCDENQLTLEM